MSELLATSIVLVIPDEEAPLSGDDAIRDPAQEAPAGLEILSASHALSAGSRITIGQKGPHVSGMTGLRDRAHE